MNPPSIADIQILREYPFWQSESLVPILTYAIIILGAIIYFFFLGILIWRFFLLRKQNKQEEYYERCSTLIYAYLDEKKKREDIASYLGDNKIQIQIFVEICIDLHKDLKGSFESRVQELLQISTIQKHYKEKLNNRDLGVIADALIFYKYCRNIDQGVKLKITELMSHNNSEIAFAAALAMVNSIKIDTQIAALENMCTRQDITQLKLLELLVILTENGSSDMSKIGEVILEIIQYKDITSSSRLVLIKSLGELRFVSQAPELYSILNSYKDQTNKKSEKISAAILEALGKLQYETILPHIEKLIRNSDSEMMKLSCAKALGALGREESIILLDILIDDSNKKVQIEAMKQLLKIGQPVLNSLPDITEANYSEIEKRTLQELTEIKYFRYG